SSASRMRPTATRFSAARRASASKLRWSRAGANGCVPRTGSSGFPISVPRRLRRRSTSISGSRRRTWRMPRAASPKPRAKDDMDLNKLKTTSGIDVAGKRVLVRADLNVPVKDGRVTDATRLERVVPGLKDLSSRGARVIVLSHFGRPKGAPSAEFSLAPVADKLAGLLGRNVTFVNDCIGPEAEKASADLKPGDIAVFENLRFHAGEEKNDPGFVKALAKSGDLYVGEAFSAAHRAHASTEGVTHLLPSYAGPLMMEEISA